MIPVGNHIIRKIWFLSPFKNSSDQLDRTPGVEVSFLKRQIQSLKNLHTAKFTFSGVQLNEVLHMRGGLCHQHSQDTALRSYLRSQAQVEGTQGFLPQPEKDLE